MSDRLRALAVDIGGTHAACALVEGRAVLAETSLAISDCRRLRDLLPELSRCLRSLAPNAESIGGLAVSFPGIVDLQTGRILSTPRGKFEDAGGLELPRWCREELGLPLRIENDARMALLGERWAGAARGSDDVVMVTLGTGVGGAAMMEGRLLRGKHFQGGCLGGHLPALFDGRVCICGNRGCVEAEASTWALPEICASWPGFSASSLAGETVLDFAALFCAAAAGDAVACEIRARCLRVWGAGVVGLIHAYDPEVVVLGGAVMNSAGQILPHLQDHVNRHAWTPWGKVELRAAELGSRAALLGAVPLLQS